MYRKLVILLFVFVYGVLGIVVDNILEKTVEVSLSSFTKNGQTKSFYISPGKNEIFARDENLKNVLVVKSIEENIYEGILVGKDCQVLIYKENGRHYLYSYDPIKGDQVLVKVGEVKNKRIEINQLVSFS
ncbi:expressed protein [Dictyostelium purpureum]|uniref:Expressed protein n=1 Tax=Dictyostelium purpureum TaxID=5786 RepID=F0ZXS0_DICPU|nr:uncharacterized protein DICPUDRAFT_92822 [Dictyostelium purpureum]EGC31273.1 expressed protein [Dictyostelium purpureum]|eukprot:XP_003292218.1 expressed protein [Dictyostelium purpureum]